MRLMKKLYVQNNQSVKKETFHNIYKFCHVIPFIFIDKLGVTECMWKVYQDLDRIHWLA